MIALLAVLTFFVGALLGSHIVMVYLLVDVRHRVMMGQQDVREEEEGLHV